jgi:hypothetical protein
MLIINFSGNAQNPSVLNAYVAGHAACKVNCLPLCKRMTIDSLDSHAFFPNENQGEKFQARSFLMIEF